MASLGSLTNNYFSTAHETFTDTTSGTISGGDATVAVTNLSEYSDGDVVTLTIAPGDATKQRTFTGVKSGSNVTSVVWTEDPYSYGTGTYAAGSTVKDLMSATHHAAMTKGILQQHTAAGAHSNITAISITTSANAAFTGTLTQTGNATFAGTVTINNKTVKKYDESSNSVDVDPVSRNEGFQGSNFVQTGLNPSAATGLVVTIPAGTYYIAGKRYTYAGGTKTLTASKDCYLDINTSGTITSVEVAPGATTGMTLTANSVRFAIVPTNGSGPTSYTTTGWDSLGNAVRPTNPSRNALGYKQRTSANYTNTETANTTANSRISDLTQTIIVPARSRAVLKFHCREVKNNNATQSTVISIWDGDNTSGGTVKNEGIISQVAGVGGWDVDFEAYIDNTTSDSDVSKTIYVTAYCTAAATNTLFAASTAPMYLRCSVEKH